VRSDVLVVDDDEDMIEALVQLLHDAGYAARSAENGRRALDAVAAQRPALVLLDVLMPVMDGWECARELRARYGRTLPIVVVTAAEHVGERCADVGADHVLPKPFELRDLLALVARYATPAAG
jgi:two-component system OmpR family response regulator